LKEGKEEEGRGLRPSAAEDISAERSCGGLFSEARVGEDCLQGDGEEEGEGGERPSASAALPRGNGGGRTVLLHVGQREVNYFYGAVSYDYDYEWDQRERNGLRTSDLVFRVDPAAARSTSTTTTRWRSPPPSPSTTSASTDEKTRWKNGDEEGQR